MEKRCSGQEGHPPAGSTLPRVNMRKKLTSLPESKAGFTMTTVLAHALIFSL